MCAINPKHQAHFILSVFTSHEMSAEEFAALVISKALMTEIKLNEDGRLRWHIGEQHK